MSPTRTTRSYLLLLLPTGRRFGVRFGLPLLLIGHDDVGARVVAARGARVRGLGFVRETLRLERAVVRPALQLPQPRFNLYEMAWCRCECPVQFEGVSAWLSLPIPGVEQSRSRPCKNLRRPTREGPGSAIQKGFGMRRSTSRATGEETIIKCRVRIQATVPY